MAAEDENTDGSVPDGGAPGEPVDPHPRASRAPRSPGEIGPGLMTHDGDVNAAEPDQYVHDVVIIGAGQAGLATAGELVRRGLTPGRELLLLDAEEGPGGAWRHRWDSLTIGRTRIADLPGIPAGEPDEAAPSNIVVPAYHRRYERALGLRVVRPARVTSVRSTDVPAPRLSAGGAHAAGGAAPTRMSRRRDPVRRDTFLAVEARTGTGRRSWLARMVVSATGTWTGPRVPHVAGADRFTGLQLHTATYRRAEDLAGRRVLVVGGGLTAVQMLLDVEPHAASVVWATRRPPNFVSAGSGDLWAAALEQVDGVRAAGGSAAARTGRGAIVPDPTEYVAAVERGMLVSRGMIDLIDERAVRFSPTATGARPDGLGAAAVVGGGLVVPDSWKPCPDPVWVGIDAIFWNTGFRPALTHLRPLHLHEGEAPAGDPTDGAPRCEAGIRMTGRTGAARDSRVLLVGYGPSASTRGAARAGAEAARRIWRRLHG